METGNQKEPHEAAPAGDAPVPVSICCPECGAQHLDEGEWATRPHKTHRCQSCGHEWRPFPYPTVGIAPSQPKGEVEAAVAVVGFLKRINEAHPVGLAQPSDWRFSPHKPVLADGLKPEWFDIEPLVTLASAQAALAASQAREARAAEALRPLAKIADAYDDNALDDEARKFWGVINEHQNKRDPEDIELYSGRGGKRLLTLADCFTARKALSEFMDNGED